MHYLITLLVFGLCFAAMAVGLIFAKKVLRKSCSDDPESCACKREGKDPAECEEK